MQCNCTCNNQDVNTSMKKPNEQKRKKKMQSVRLTLPPYGLMKGTVKSGCTLLFLLYFSHF